jgi:hypothetical protein
MNHLPILNFPAYAPRVEIKEQKAFIYDTIRKKMVSLTPEEWVRQHTIQFLVNHLAVPASLISVEGGLKFNKLNKRTDIVVYNNKLNPMLVVECKAPSVKITQSVFDQAARYNFTLKSNYLMVSNGLNHFYCEINSDEGTYTFIENLPSYSGWPLK